METITSLANAIVSVAALVPAWLWQIMGAFVLTMVIMQTIKLFQPGSWPPSRRRKINRGLSIIIGGSAIAYLYDHGAKDFVIVTFMLGNSFLYTGLADLVSYKAKTHNGIWTVLNAFFRPHVRRRQTYLARSNGVVKERDVDTDATVRVFPLQEDRRDAE